MRPVVALTSTREIIRDALRVRVNASYVRALEGAGAVPVIVPPLDTPDTAVAFLARCDALLLTGGEDVDPAHYGAPRHPMVGEINAARDATEMALVRAARDRELPTLAICRGVQLLNVALGGTLVQDIPSDHPSPLPHDAGTARDARVHDINIAIGSRLATAVGATTLQVNSFHHQAIARVAPPLAACAWASDGVIEGVESTSDAWWAVGVQWHPEELVASLEPWDRELFSALVARASSSER